MSKFKTNAILGRQAVAVDYILFFEETTHFNEKLYLGFKPHFS
jgi:hypothetical protein